MRLGKRDTGARSGTTTIERPPTNGAAAGPSMPKPAPVLATPKRRRRPLLIAVGVMLAVLAAAGTYWLVNTSTDRVAVVGVAHDVQWGEVIAADDLVQVQIVQDPSLIAVPWSSMSTLVGQRAAMDLAEGSLLTPASLTGADAVPAEGQAMVGVAVQQGQLPATALVPGDRVSLVITPDPNARAEIGQDAAAGSVETVPAVVFSVGAVESGGKRTVDVLVEVAAATDLAVAVSQDRVSIVVVPRG